MNDVEETRVTDQKPRHPDLASMSFHQVTAEFIISNRKNCFVVIASYVMKLASRGVGEVWGS